MSGPPKARCLDRPVLASLDDLVPAGHYYRHPDTTLDLGFVRNWVARGYAARGRPSIAPAVFFERQRIAAPSLNLAHRWDGIVT